MQKELEFYVMEAAANLPARTEDISPVAEYAKLHVDFHRGEVTIDDSDVKLGLEHFLRVAGEIHNYLFKYRWSIQMGPWEASFMSEDESKGLAEREEP